MMSLKQRQSMQSQGFTLVEVLVALVVMSVGMLGIAALYVSGVQGTRGAIYQTKAINLAADMADRIRVNRTVPAAYAGAGAGAASDCADTNFAGANLCTPAQIAANDVFVWNQSLTNPRTGLPAPNGGVQMGTVGVNPATNPPTYTITVNWSEPGLGDVSYVLTVEM